MTKKNTSKMAALCGLAACAAASLAMAKPVPVIFDTDMGNDVDDALAMAMAHTMQSKGECEILAVTVNKDNPYAGIFCDIINTFYGRPEIPIGVVKGSNVTPEAGHFVEIASERRMADGRYLYPRCIEQGKEFLDATQVIRQALVNAEDNSVVFVVIGFSTNLDRLLKSPADDISPLSGKDLLAKKGKLISIMAGDFSPKKKIAEWNVRQDVPSARDFYRDCPIPMVFSGWEIGKDVLYPWTSIENDYGWAANNPVVDGYKLFRKGKPHDRPSWDLLSMLYAVHPDEKYYSLSKPGKVSVVDDAGMVDFVEDAKGTHRIMLMSDAQRATVLKELIALSAQPR